MTKYLTRIEMEELSKLLNWAYRFVKGGPSPNLEDELLKYANKVNSFLEQNIDNEPDQYLSCPLCGFEYSHMLATLTITDRDQYKATDIVVNGLYHISTNIEYKYRSQGNIHILFSCEDGHFFIKSFDGHKGIVRVDSNPLMGELAEFLNEYYRDRLYALYTFNYELLGNIEKFFKKKTNEMY